MNERFKLVRKTLGLTQKKIGEILGITEGAVSNIEKGSRNVTVQMQKAICREFNVDYLWLTEGIGEMFQQQDDESELDDMIDRLLDGDRYSNIREALKRFSRLNDADWEMLDNILDKLINNNEEPEK